MLRLRTVAAATAAVLLVTFSTQQGALAQEGAPSVTVTPNTGLEGGQTVLVEASGFTGTPTASWAVAQCDAAVVGATDATTVNLNCIASNAVRVEPGSPSFSAQLTVVLTGPNFGGPPTPITCGAAPGDCVILVGQLLVGGGAQVATAPISFGTPTPQAKADCKNGGWRNLADAQGRSFPNQGQCVRYAVAHRR
jgi:hypothetical protein